MAYPIVRRILFPVVGLWIKEINGIDNIPKQGPFIIAANHTSYLDHYIMGCLIIPRLNKKLHFLAKKEHFDNFLKKAWHTYGGAIPVDRKKGGIIEIFPEGTRSYDGKLQKAYTGIARLALTAKVPVLPAGIIGSEKVMPKGALFPRFARCDVKIGKPITFEKYYGKKPNNRIFEEVTRSIMKEIAKLTNQQYNY